MAYDEIGIASPSNPLIKGWRSLQRADERRQRGQFVVEGQRAVQGFLDHGWQPQAVLAAEGRDFPDVDFGIPHYRISSAAFAKVSTMTSPSGHAAVFAIPAAVALDPAQATVVLVELSDPGNMGTMLRTAAAMGWTQVLIVGGVDPYAPKVVAASVGAMAGLRMQRCLALAEPRSILGTLPLVGLVPRGGVHPLAANVPMPCWLAVGSEAHGLDAAWSAAADRLLTIPMVPGVESLNAAVAGSIACWALSPCAAIGARSSAEC